MAKRKYPFESMEVNESLIIAEGGSKELNIYATIARSWVKRNNLDWKFSFRQIGDNKIKVWRIK